MTPSTPIAIIGLLSFVALMCAIGLANCLGWLKPRPKREHALDLPTFPKKLEPVLEWNPKTVALQLYEAGFIEKDALLKVMQTGSFDTVKDYEIRKNPSIRNLERLNIQISKSLNVQMFKNSQSQKLGGSDV